MYFINISDLVSHSKTQKGSCDTYKINRFNEGYVSMSYSPFHTHINSLAHKILFFNKSVSLCATRLLCC